MRHWRISTEYFGLDLSAFKQWIEKKNSEWLQYSRFLVVFGEKKKNTQSDPEVEDGRAQLNEFDWCYY